MNQNDNPNPLCINEITGTNLWIGNLQSLKEIPKISKHRDQGWTIVSVVASDKIVQFTRLAVKALNTGSSTLQHQHHTWQLADNSHCNFLCDRLVELLAVLDEAEAHARPCLVHCAMGVSRSAALCAAWLLHNNSSRSSRHTTVAAALVTLRNARPGVQPNRGLMAALRAIELQGSVSEAIRLAQKQPQPQPTSLPQETNAVVDRTTQT